MFYADSRYVGFKKMIPHVETVVLLFQLKQKPDDYINVTIELDDVDITSSDK